MIRIKPSAHILLVALALGWSVDLLFYGKALGISIPLFVLLLMVPPMHLQCCRYSCFLENSRCSQPSKPQRPSIRRFSD